MVKTRVLDAVLVSAMKSGSTWLASMCSQFKDVFLCKRFEVDYRAERIKPYLHGYKKEKVVLGKRNMKPKIEDARIYYKHNEDMKFIMGIRNPINRTFSQFVHYVYKEKRKDIPLLDPKAIDSENKLIDINIDVEARKDKYLKRDVGWVKKSEYFTCLSPFLSLFPRRNVLIIPMELMTADPKYWLEKVSAFLDLEFNYKLKGMYKIINPGRDRVSKWRKPFVKKAYKFAPPNASTEKFLAGLFLDEVRKTGDLIGMDLMEFWGLNKLV